MTQTTTTVRGRFRKRIYRSPEEYGIALFDLVDFDEELPPDVMQRGTFVAKGSMIPELDAFNVRFTGRWERDKRRDGGMFFAVRAFSQENPVTKDGIIKVLSSGLYKGIGPKTAERIYDTFKSDSLEIVLHQTERLREVKRIGVATVVSIIESVKASVELNELVAFLAVYGISLNKIKKIQQEFPDNPKDVIEREPFKLCKIRGFGFKVVDAIASKLGTPLDSSLRIQCAIDEVLREANGEGHLYTKKPSLLKRVNELLNHRAKPGEAVSLNYVEAELQIMELDSKVFIERDYEGEFIVYRRKDYEQECGAAKSLVKLLRSPFDKQRAFQGEWIEDEMAKAEKAFGLTLSSKQREAVQTALTQKVCVITGGPGTGKTTTLRFILDLYLRGVNQSCTEEDERPGILLMAPTGKAARRMSESSGQSAFTIHKGLGITPDSEASNFSPDSMLDETIGLVVVDEISMMDMALAAKLLEAISPSAQLVLIGDYDQLPSVGPGSVLNEIVHSGAVPVVRLDVIYRQGETSLIVKNAHRIRQGQTDLQIDKTSFAFFPTQPGEDNRAQDVLIDLYLRAVKKYGYSEAQILCPRRDEVAASAKIINKSVQQRLYVGSDTPKCTIGGQTWYLGERIIQTKNTDKANNGDLGVIRSIERDPGQPESFVIGIHFDFMPEGETVEYFAEDFDNLLLAYAITIHKAQGSECKAVFIPVLQSQIHMLRRNLLYTGVTRGKEIVVLAGQAESVRTAIRRTDTNRRNTLLGARIKEIFFG